MRGAGERRKRKYVPRGELSLIGHAELLTRYSYDPSTGHFTHLAPGSFCGQRAGYRLLSGYWGIVISSKQYRAHRLAWFYVHGEWPSRDLDHINGDRLDNRISNLRLATRAENNANAALRNDSTSGFKGVSYAKDRKRWIAQIGHNGKSRFLGRFPTREEAYTVYCRAAAETFGEFARLK